MTNASLIKSLLLVLMTALSFQTAQAVEDMSSLIDYNLAKNSLSDASQTKIIYELIFQEINKSKSEAESLERIKWAIKGLHLPSFDPKSQNLKVELPTASTAFPIKDNRVGLQIEDETHVYCFPCKKGYGNYTFGILKKNELKDCSVREITLTRVPDAPASCDAVHLEGTFTLVRCLNNRGELRHSSGLTFALFKRGASWQYKKEVIDFDKKQVESDQGFFGPSLDSLTILRTTRDSDGFERDKKECRSQVSSR